VQRVFSMVTALWMDERNRLEVSTVDSVVLVKYQFHNCKCLEFHKFLLQDHKIFEHVNSSCKHRSAPTLPTQMKEVPLTHATASTSLHLEFLGFWTPSIIQYSRN
jgi:hypothetical protein